MKRRLLELLLILMGITDTDLPDMAIAHGAALPAYGAEKHMGVSACASSQCHGAGKKYENGHLRRNEYLYWSKEDKHANAYTVLSNERSMMMARKMGISKPNREKICLDCHADNVPSELRGEKFQIEDGVGCESCHGGSENWIKSHKEEGTTHADNIARGMYPTEQPLDRGKLCLSCHYGDETKFATHRIMAAGHPRLRFELDGFTIRQEHYDLDKAYRNRKTLVDSANTWANGIAVQAGETARMIDASKNGTGGLFPELALFDCHACHHAMKDKRWALRQTTSGLSPGAVRINDSSFIMLYAILKRINEEGADQLLASLRELHEATEKSRDLVSQKSRELKSKIDGMKEIVKKRHLDRSDAAAIRKIILNLGSRGEFRDYTGAEQAWFSIDLLTYFLGEDKLLKTYVDNLFELLRDEAQFHPSEFTQAVTKMDEKIDERSKK